MTFSQFGTPKFPFTQKLVKRGDIPVLSIPAQHLYRRRWRTGASIQQSDVRLAPRKRLVEHWEISNHYRQQTKAGGSFYHRHKTRQTGAWYHITQAKRNKRRTAHIQVSGE